MFADIEFMGWIFETKHLGFVIIALMAIIGSWYLLLRKKSDENPENPNPQPPKQP